METLYFVEARLSLMTVETCGPAHVREYLGNFTDVALAVDCARRYATREYSADFVRQAVEDIIVREHRFHGCSFDPLSGSVVWSAASAGILARYK